MVSVSLEGYCGVWRTTQWGIWVTHPYFVVSLCQSSSFHVFLLVHLLCRRAPLTRLLPMTRIYPPHSTATAPLRKTPRPYNSQESAVAPGTTPPSGAFALREIPPFKPILQNRTQSKGSTASSSTVKPETETARPPHIHAHFPSPTTISRYPSTSASTSTSRARPSTPPAPAHRVVATSEITGCTISAPISPPAHYPIPTPPPSRDHFQPNTPSSSSTASTRSSSSSGRSSLSAPPPPRWARPPTKSNSVSGRALSMNNKDRPDVDFDFQHDFDPELFEGQEGEWIEIIKGSEGRIAVKSTPKEYLVMVWLPGFQ